MTTSLTDQFPDTPKEPELMDATTYQSVLESLLGEGQGWGKTVNVGAYLLEDITLVTETSSGKDETAKNISVEKLYVTMDLDQYKSEHVRGLVIKDIAKNWGGKTIGERDLDDPDFKGPGIWTIKQGSFEFDYLKEDENDRTNSIHKPNPEAYRVCLTVDEDVKIPVQWGDFVVEAGGTLAIRERDVQELAEALTAIKNGETTAEEALYTTNDSGDQVARFDIYGMEPGFLEDNYGLVELKAETQATNATFASANTNVAKPAAKKTNGFKK